MPIGGGDATLDTHYHLAMAGQSTYSHHAFFLLRMLDTQPCRDKTVTTFFITKTIAEITAVSSSRISPSAVRITSNDII